MAKKRKRTEGEPAKDISHGALSLAGRIVANGLADPSKGYDAYEFRNQSIMADGTVRLEIGHMQSTSVLPDWVVTIKAV